MKKKCTQCGSTKLAKANFSLTDTMDVSLPIDIYVCEDCGHIEFFKREESKEPKEKEVY